MLPGQRLLFIPDCQLDRADRRLQDPEMVSAGEDGEKKRGVKRERGEESLEVEKRRRGEDAGVLEDKEPRPGSSQAPGTSTPCPKCTIKRFKFHQVLGRGSFGVVSLASAPGRNNYVAVKSVNKTGRNAATIRRERQILMLARDCPFLCHLYAAQQSQDQAFFITEYLSGGSLEALLRKCGCLNIDQVRFYTAEIACGLQFLHGHNIVHRDIKPDNIMLDRDGHIRLIDLGLARDGVTSSNKLFGEAGTLRYMAPEVFHKGYYTACDWWSLGIVVCRMSAGYIPFYYGRYRRMVRHSITNSEPNIPSWLPADLQHLMTELLCKTPEERLGVNKNIRDHPFFTTINLEELEQRRAQPPFIPPMAALKEEDLQWPERKSALHPLEGFSFIAPSWALKDQPMATAQSSVPPDPCLCCCSRPRPANNILSTVLQISIKLFSWIFPPHPPISGTS